jgi:hypothetical protein
MIGTSRSGSAFQILQKGLGALSDFSASGAA